MNAFDRGKRGNLSIYVPMKNGALLQRSTGSASKKTARQMKRMVEQLRDEHRWPLLEAVRLGDLTLRDLYVAYASDRLDELEASLTAADLREHLDGWYAWVKGNRREGVGTADEYLRQVTTLIPQRGLNGRDESKPFLAPELTKARVVAWLAGMQYRHRTGEPKGVSSGYKRKCLYALKSFVRYLLDVGVLETDPLAGLKAPKKNPPRERWETADRDQTIVAAALPEYRAFFAFIKATGCDVGSARRARLGDLDLAKARANIRGTKTDTRRVFRATIEPWALPILKKHLETILGANTLVFPGITNSGASHHHAHVCRVLGIADYTLKDARHSVGVRMRLAGHSFEDIAQQLGTSVYQAVTVYTRYKPESAATTTGSAT